MNARLVLSLLLIIAVAPTWAAPREGRLGVLVDVHGTHAGDRVLVPLRGVAEWLGATVEYRRPEIQVSLADRIVTLTVDSPRADVDGSAYHLLAPPAIYGGVTCVPVRFVAEALGCEVSYVGHDPGPGLQALGFISHVVLRGPRGVGRVLIHRVTPDVTAGILAAQERGGTLPVPGVDYLLHVSLRAGNWAKAHLPLWLDEHGFGQIWRTGVYHLEGGQWRLVYFTSRVSHTVDDLNAAGEEQVLWGRWMWEGYYTLKRMAGQQRQNAAAKGAIEALAEGLHEDDFRAIEWMGTAARWADLLTRGRQGDYDELSES